MHHFLTISDTIHPDWKWGKITACIQKHFLFKVKYEIKIFVGKVRASKVVLDDTQQTLDKLGKCKIKAKKGQQNLPGAEVT